MVLLPNAIVALLNQFAPLFSRRTWRHVPILVVAALHPQPLRQSERLRWICLMRLVPIAWAARVWAPPSERTELGKA
jgi:hypothetical protein